MPVRSMTLTTGDHHTTRTPHVSDACQINDFDHICVGGMSAASVSDACQINDFDHCGAVVPVRAIVSDACQINDFDHTHHVTINA